MKTNKGVLIFNQSFIDLSVISSLLEAEECTVFVSSRPLEAIHILRNNDIDVIMASSHLEGMDSEEFKDLAEKIKPGVSIFFLSFTQQQKDSKTHATECTLNLSEFVQFIRNHIKVESHLADEASKFKDFFFTFTDRLLQLFEVKDKFFFNNDQLVASLSRKVALKMNLEEELVDAIFLAALLRDVGKIVIQNEILNQTGRLGDDAIAIIKSHPLNSVQLLKQINFPWNVESIIRHHHEHYNGNGYPDGIKARYIPLGSRIIAIVDSYVAMTTDRPYRKAKSSENAISEIMKMAGTQFDPEVVEVFFSVLQKENSSENKRRPILVLDQDQAVVSFLKLNLNSKDYDIVAVDNAASALAYVEEKNPYLIIADDETLRNGNFGFYSELRENKKNNNIPFIVLLSGEEYPNQYVDPMVYFIAKPIDIGLLTAKIDSLFKEIHPRKIMLTSEEELKGVSGSLEDMGLTDIIQVLHMGVKTANVVLSNRHGIGEIHLKDGKIICARLGSLIGQEAFYELLTWEKGIFRIFHGKISEEVNITMDTMNLLLEATKVLDEKNRH